MRSELSQSSGHGIQEQRRGKRLSKKRERPRYRGLEISWRQDDVVKFQPECTVDEWFWCWLYQYKATTVKKGTLENYECMYRYYVQPELGNRILREVAGEEIQMFYNRMARDGYAGATICLLRAILNSMFSQAYRNGYLTRNPMEQAILPKAIGKSERRVLTAEEQMLLLKYSHGKEIEGIIFTALSTGMRIGEITGLEWQDVDFRQQEIIVSGTLKNMRDGKFYKDEPKTINSRRVIPMIPQLSILLADTDV